MSQADLYTRLPDNFTLKPQLYSSSWMTTASLAVSNGVALNVVLNGGSASQPGEVCAFTVTIQSFTPLPASVPNIYHWCVDQWYSDPGGVSATTACPAYQRPAGEGNVVFASSMPGAMATASVGIVGDTGQSSQPAQIPSADQARNVVLGITVPAAGTYTFVVGLWQDQAGPSLTVPSLTQTFLAKQALHEWSGQACTQSSMQAQLPPPTNPPTQLVCPGPPPT